MTAVLALTIAAMATTVVVIGLRLSGAKSDRDKARAAQKVAEDTAIEVSEESARYKKHKEAQIRSLLEDIEDLENDLENCSTPGSKRERLRSLVSKAKAAQTDHA